MAPGKREMVVVVVCKWTDMGLCCCSVWVVVVFFLYSFCVLLGVVQWGSPRRLDDLARKPVHGSVRGLWASVFA